MLHFIQWWLGVSVVTMAALSVSGLAPAKLREAENSVLSSLMNRNVSAEISPETANEIVDGLRQIIEQPEVPTHLTIPSGGIDFDIVLPESEDVSDLDAALAKGVVHYPGSGLLGERDNILLFGHSSHLKYVRNPAYKALTGIERLQYGDGIFVRGKKYEYEYRVTSIRLADKDEEMIPFGTGRAELTISTCNTFGAKDDRYVVKAEYHGRTQIPSGQDSVR